MESVIENERETVYIVIILVALSTLLCGSLSIIVRIRPALPQQLSC